MKIQYNLSKNSLQTSVFWKGKGTCVFAVRVTKARVGIKRQFLGWKQLGSEGSAHLS